MAQLHDNSMSAPDLEAILDKTAEYLGIADAEEEAKLLRYVTAAAELCSMQTGEEAFDSESAQQAVISKAAMMYADRFGELNNKEGSAMAQEMRNLNFALRIKNIRRQDDETGNDIQG